jgi:hypothetical protein
MRLESYQYRSTFSKIVNSRDVERSSAVFTSLIRVELVSKRSHHLQNFDFILFRGQVQRSLLLVIKKACINVPEKIHFAMEN